MAETASPDLIRMQRRQEALEKSNMELRLKLSRTDAEKQIAALESEGVIFGDTLEAHEAGKAEETEFLALLEDPDRVQQVNVMRTRYKRKRPDPANPANPGVARYARTPDNTDGPGAEEDEFDPQDPQEASDYADLLVVKKMNKAEAVKFMRKRTGR